MQNVAVSTEKASKEVTSEIGPNIPVKNIFNALVEVEEGELMESVLNDNQEGKIVDKETKDSSVTEVNKEELDVAESGGIVSTGIEDQTIKTKPVQDCVALHPGRCSGRSSEFCTDRPSRYPYRPGR
ncbi:hypothetical protein MA16_Dca017742 [Dendrobium catenatum]|uniref:Uncharacterized protein n=1 Tax=Dendrobium catenatum TaxID=906689 RepID=A0A2I0W6Q5_9ASPA|nr:hypothetical protein MA16_Dca017742 [Dendrobium catenatum]